MANWYSNTLDIIGPDENVAQLRALVNTSESQMDFEAVEPSPTVADLESLADEQVKAEGAAADISIYSLISEWRIRNWLSTCNARHVEWASDAEAAGRGVSASVFYRTTYAPGEKISERLAKLFPSLELRHRYFSFDAEWRGSWTYKSGSLVACEGERFVPEEHLHAVSAPVTAGGEGYSQGEEDFFSPEDNFPTASIASPFEGEGDRQSPVQDDVNLVG